MVTARSFGPEVEIVTGACPHDCPDTCTFQVAVDRSDGRALDIWGHRAHPLTAGSLCTKVDRYLDRTYHQDRLQYPLRRVGPKGEGRFERVSWQEAVTDITAKLKDVIAQHGAESVLPYSYAGTMGLAQGEGMAARFFNRMGATQLARSICSEAGFEGLSYTLGRGVGTNPEDFAHSDLIWIWGSNTLTSNMHLWPQVQGARERGAKVVVIDPVRTRTAKLADQWVAIQPGTDGALALGIMHVLIAEQFVDHDYIARATLGFERLSERVARFAPARVAEITGLDQETILALARSYARANAPAIRVNYGLQRHAGGGMAVRNIACLPALVGAWKKRGGGVLLTTSGFFPFDYSMLHRADLLPNPAPRTLNMNRLGDALSCDSQAIARAHHHPRPSDSVPAPDQAGPFVHALIVYNSNPAAVAPDQGAVVRGLGRSDLFTVVLEHFQTDTADWADYVLPATTQLEHWDVVKPYGHFYLALNRPAIDPVGESKPNTEIFRLLSQAMGYADACFTESDEEMLRALVDAQRHPYFQGVSFEHMLEHGYVRMNVPDLPFADGNFPSPSGKCEFYCERMVKDGYDPLPSYTPPRVSDHDAIHPLVCLSPPAHGFLNSTFVNIDRLRKREGEPSLLVHSADAAPRALSTGDHARVYNARGDLVLRVKVVDDIVPGTVVAPGVWWSKLSPGRKNINQLVPQDEADMGAGALFYDIRVEVEKTG
jgi:anaerobic selenocysteine-containing dehydrogenase